MGRERKIGSFKSGKIIYLEEYDLLKKFYVRFVQLVLRHEHALDQFNQEREQENR